LFELPIVPFCQHDHAHAAATQFPPYPPAADVCAGGRRFAVARPIRRHGDAQLWNMLIQRAAGRIRLQQRHNFAAQLAVVPAALLQQRVPFRYRRLASLIEHGADALPALGIHA